MLDEFYDEYYKTDDIIRVLLCDDTIALTVEGVKYLRKLVYESELPENIKKLYYNHETMYQIIRMKRHDPFLIKTMKNLGKHPNCNYRAVYEYSSAYIMKISKKYMHKYYIVELSNYMEEILSKDGEYIESL